MTRPWSPAAQFLLSAKEARGSSLGDREYIRLMHDLLEMSIQYRMKFDHHELLELSRLLDFHTNVGVFRLICSHAYAQACWYESSYAIAYQVACGMNPWKIPKLYAEGFQYREIEGIPGIAPVYGHKRVFKGSNTLMRLQTKSCKPKVAVGLYVELPDEASLFRCTVAEKDRIRFVPNEPDKSSRKRLEFSRTEWAQMYP